MDSGRTVELSTHTRLGHWSLAPVTLTGLAQGFESDEMRTSLRTFTSATLKHVTVCTGSALSKSPPTMMVVCRRFPEKKKSYVARSVNDEPCQTCQSNLVTALEVARRPRQRAHGGVAGVPPVKLA